MPKCPACGGRMRSMDMMRQSLTCPWCKVKLRWAWGLSRFECSVIGVLFLFVPFLLAFRLWPGKYAPLLEGVLNILSAPIIGFLYLLVRAILVPAKLRRDSGWPDEGTILHITSPPEPPAE